MPVPELVTSISHLHRSKVISQINKTLLPLIEEDSNFDGQHLHFEGPPGAGRLVDKDLKDTYLAMVMH